MRFNIPLQRDDLVHASENEDEYYVKEVLTILELKTKLKVSKSRL